jgi:DNA-binding MarR family transcriptional regulator/GNAT superfamily N-acetyltransferase
VLYELAHREQTTPTELAAGLSLDPGYLSRILRAFRKRGWLETSSSKIDGRKRMLRLTRRGRQAFAPLEARSRSEVKAMLAGRTDAEQHRLNGAMQIIESLLGENAGGKQPYLLRPHQPGDIGWVVHRHGVLYAREYGWDERFEAMVAGIAARFVERFDPKRERCWIAERDGDIVGSVFLVRKSATVAQLRLLLVEPEARGMGLGARLVDECERFARQAGYRKIMLWTNDILAAARHIYRRARYLLVGKEKHRSFGHQLIGETWELKL